MTVIYLQAIIKVIQTKIIFIAIDKINYLVTIYCPLLLGR